MANEKAVNYLAEFDGTGAPTGKCWIDGTLYTFTASSADGDFREPATTGKSTDKFTVAFAALVSGQLPQTATSSIDITVVKTRGGKHSAVTHTK